jgi:hypothetical protein
MIRRVGWDKVAGIMVGLRKPAESRPKAHQNHGLLVPPYELAMGGPA